MTTTGADRASDVLIRVCGALQARPADDLIDLTIEDECEATPCILKP